MSFPPLFFFSFLASNAESCSSGGFTTYVKHTHLTHDTDVRTNAAISTKRINHPADEILLFPPLIFHPPINRASAHSTDPHASPFFSPHLHEYFVSTKEL